MIQSPVSPPDRPLQHRSRPAVPGAARNGRIHGVPPLAGPQVAVALMTLLAATLEAAQRAQIEATQTEARARHVLPRRVNPFPLGAHAGLNGLFLPSPQSAALGIHTQGAHIPHHGPGPPYGEKMGRIGTEAGVTEIAMTAVSGGGEARRRPRPGSPLLVGREASAPSARG